MTIRRLWPAAAIAFVLAGTGTAEADGYEFFTVDRTREVNLVYVGQIRDKHTGTLVRAPAYFMVTEKGSGMTFPFVNDRPGHYRSPDIGESVEDLAGITVDPRNLSFELVVEGYEKLTVSGAPRKSQGVVEFNFAVERTGTAGAGGDTAAVMPQAIIPSDAPPTAPADPEGGARRRLILLAVAAAAMVTGGAVRTLGRRPATAG